MPYEHELKSLSNPIRQSVINELAQRPMSVRELTVKIDVSQPVMSQHLKVLKEAGLIEVRPEGTRNIYCVNKEKLEEIRAFWTAHWSNLLASLNEQKE
ncbi:HTH-type transcriptional regulator [Pelagimonas phthalicica]|uniref:HTH-type transcriptional regulator n=1 Tax=Pelagimonas phthalicica TaxID=1037362 RepID=A0A238JGH6_9RHOB|nr:metalloregulator ArsR/SmtB family transcription factor [Pelagimonas phthalicica]TDS89023.1 ArsR family transcriptional regulator [Pelagimonas phthalicica]SMX29801.1 HTH-type transcriptional regulator [Pelagimonas phthalicica]